MYRPRLIPVLLLKDKGLVKSRQFKEYTYIGDPINAVKVFNDLKVDELIFLDIQATKENRLISLDFIKKVGEEAHMPFAVGGGIKTIEHIRDILLAGAERVVINSSAGLHPDFITTASETFGSTTIIVCIDIKKDIWGKEKVWIKNAGKALAYSPVTFAKMMQQCGAGELIIQSVTLDGTMKGYDTNLIKEIAEAVTIPIVALGGAGNLDHVKKTYKEGFVNGLAAGSMFVYYGSKKGVLLNYPDDLKNLFN